MTDDKPTEAEEIFSEFQKKKAENEKPLVPEPQQIEPEPEPQQIEPEPEPQQIEPEPVKEENPVSEVSSTPESKVIDDTKHLERNVIFVGVKPIMTYVTATLTQLSSQPTVTIKARGKRITQAVDVSQMIVKRMDSVGYVISDVRIASDSLTSQDGRQRNVSTIEIDVTKT
jgi:DNA-binding protein Alba